MAYFQNSFICPSALFAQLKYGRKWTLGSDLTQTPEALKAPCANRPGVWPPEAALLCSDSVNSKFIFLASSSPQAWFFSPDMGIDVLMF